MLREYVKWDYELRIPSQVEAVVDRAFELMLSEPRGPVYLTLPREVLAAPLSSLDITSPPAATSAALRLPGSRAGRGGGAAPRRRPPAAHPGLGAGRDPAAVPRLVALAEAGGIGVVEVDPTHVNFPQSHPLHVGFTQPSGTDPALGLADVILVVDCRRAVVSLARQARRRRRGDPPGRRSRVLALSHAELPVRRADRRASRGGAAAPRGRRATPRRPRGGGRPQARVEAMHRERRAGWAADADAQAGWPPPASPGSTRCLQVCSTTRRWSSTSTRSTAASGFDRPRSFFGQPHSSGLGWGLPAALGSSSPRRQHGDRRARRRLLSLQRAGGLPHGRRASTGCPSSP